MRCPYWALSVAIVRGCVDGRPLLLPFGQTGRGPFAGLVGVRARVGRSCSEVRRPPADLRSAGRALIAAGVGRWWRRRPRVPRSRMPGAAPICRDASRWVAGCSTIWTFRHRKPSLFAHFRSPECDLGEQECGARPNCTSMPTAPTIRAECADLWRRRFHIAEHASTGQDSCHDLGPGSIRRAPCPACENPATGSVTRAPNPGQQAGQGCGPAIRGSLSPAAGRAQVRRPPWPFSASSRSRRAFSRSSGVRAGGSASMMSRPIAAAYWSTSSRLSR